MGTSSRQARSPLLLALAACLATPVAAQQSNSFYGETRGWYVSAQTTNGRFSGCVMERPPVAGQLDILMKRENGQWWIAVPTQLPEGSRATIDMDVDKYSNVMNGTVQNGFLAAPMTHEWVETIGHADRITLYMNSRANEISASGTMAAIQKVDECAINSGRSQQAAAPAPRPMPAPTPAPMPMPVPVPQPAVLGANCPAPGSFVSPNMQDWGDITFVNRAGQPLTVYWLDYAGQPQEMGQVPADYQMKIQSIAGHYFVATDASRSCHGGAIEVPFGETSHDLR
ncbi:hypothetical protein [Pseudooceanicola nanhaiensis]|uniref:hypothetical protein n=1 Tax=Pseudooceanicola nanhaiensis TaxID=375761 RepID=UPI001CD35AF0|nr:hypothetical protein [Pseudooceanicola nanhaiensis]MCA0920867.1 hypothetical protein [Pseudooceanicola nanhaiensis]